MELVAPWTSPELVADTGLLVTELVANAVFHGGSRIRLDLSVHPGLHVHAEVFDSSLDPPVLRPLDSDSFSGRGLRLVEVADRVRLGDAGRPRRQDRLVRARRAAPQRVQRVARVVR